MSLYRRRKVDAAAERQILTGMITSDRFLREMSALYRPELIQAPFARIVADWCLSFYETHQAAPKEHIQDIFNSARQADKIDDELLDAIEDFLENISDEYERSEKFNDGYLLERAEKHLQSEAMSQLAEDIKGRIAQGDIEEADLSIVQFRKPERIIAESVDPYDNEEAVREAFDGGSTTPLFKLPGKLGREFNEEFTRNAFVSILAPEKRGKTWWLLFIAHLAYRQRCNVAFIAVGDMTRDQIIRRQHIHLAKKSDREKFCGDMLVPVLDCEYNQRDTCELADRCCDFGIYEGDEKLTWEEAQKENYEPCTACHKAKRKMFKGAVWYEQREKVTPLGWREALDNGEKFKKQIRGQKMMVAAYPAFMLNIRGLENQLDLWEQQEDFIPDVIIIDYADNLAPEDGRKETRHQINETWARMRGLSQERNCCVITASQADSNSYGKKDITMSNFSEDKRKLGHVTGMIALNQTDDEKVEGIMRWGSVIAREDSFSIHKQVHVLQCIEIGRPYLNSY
jgi:hypothetical protein